MEISPIRSRILNCQSSPKNRWILSRIAKITEGIISWENQSNPLLSLTVAGVELRRELRQARWVRYLVDVFAQPGRICFRLVKGMRISYPFIRQIRAFVCWPNADPTLLRAHNVVAPMIHQACGRHSYAPQEGWLA